MSKPKVLLAARDAGFRQLLGSTLGAETFDLLQATDTEEALATAQLQHPDLLLLDSQMALQDGFHLCRSLKGQPATAGTKIVLLTAERSEQGRDLARDTGADDYLTRPFSPVRLLDKVHALIE